MNSFMDSMTEAFRSSGLLELVNGGDCTKESSTPKEVESTIKGNNNGWMDGSRETQNALNTLFLKGKSKWID